MDDQRWLEEPYAAQDIKQAKIDEIVTELYKDTDLLDIIDSINGAEVELLGELADLIKDQSTSSDEIGNKLLEIIQQQYEREAEDEV